VALQKESVSWASKETEEGELKINSTSGKVLVVFFNSESTKHYISATRIETNSDRKISAQPSLVIYITGKVIEKTKEVEMSQPVVPPTVEAGASTQPNSQTTAAPVPPAPESIQIPVQRSIPPLRLVNRPYRLVRQVEQPV